MGSPTQIAMKEQAVNEEMMMAVWEHGFMVRGKLDALQTQHDDLVKDNIKLKNEIIQLETAHADTWPLHIKGVQEKVEVIYTQFKDLDDQIRADCLANIAAQAEAKRTKAWQFGTEGGKRKGIERACDYYFQTLGRIFFEVELFYHKDLANLADLIDKEASKPIAKETPNAQNAIITFSDAQEEQALFPRELAAIFEAAENKFRAKAESINKETLIVQEENNRLKQEKTQLKSTHARKLAICHSYLERYLAFRWERVNTCCWSNIHCDRPLPTFSLEQRTNPASAYSCSYATTVSERIEKFMSKWEEITPLIDTLLKV